MGGCAPIPSPDEVILVGYEAHAHGLLVDFNVSLTHPVYPNLCHTVSRHGPQLKNVKLLERFEKPYVHFSSKFYSTEHLYYCREVFLENAIRDMERCKALALEEGEQNFSYQAVMVFGQPVGYGFSRDNHDFPAVDVQAVMYTYEWQEEYRTCFEVRAYPFVEANPSDVQTDQADKIIYEV